MEMNKTTLICLLGALLTCACSERMICPAYQSSFILDEDYRKELFSPFTVDAGDTVPKGAFYGQRFTRNSQEKEGFVYENREKKSFLTRIWSRPERPVLENPYLLDRIFKKRPYWKLDIIKPELVHYSNVDTVDLDVPMLTDSLGQVIADTTGVVNENPSFSVLTVPERYKGYNIDQIMYNNKFGHLFPKPPPPPAPVDSAALAAAADSLANDTTATKKKGIFGLFNKKNKPPKEKKKRDKKKKKNEEGTKEEDEGIG